MSPESPDTPDPLADAPKAVHEAVFAALATEPGTGVTIVTNDGRIQWGNDAAARIFHGDAAKASDWIGRSWKDSMPPDWARERAEILEKVRHEGSPLLIRVIWQGHQHFTWIYPIPADHECPERFLTITRRIPDPDAADEFASEGVEVIESDVARLGRLDVLTDRELEVLSLIGQGLSAKEIARVLSRSEKTIENHRDAIGRKLHESSRVKLAAIARTAGLALNDSEKKRV